jgi:arsenate reductase
MPLTIYTYKNCDTCRKALKYLNAKGIEYKNKPIRETPPTKKELNAMLGYMDGEIKKLFNTSGMDYKSLNMKDKLPGLSEKDAIELLNGNGNLVKRPFLLGEGIGTVGFKEPFWDELFSTFF